MALPERDTILILCTANVCRSPMAEALIRSALGAEGEPLSELRVISAGIASIDGDQVSENSVVTMKKVGLDISGHRSRRLTNELLERSLAIFVMTESHRSVVLAHTSGDARVTKHVYLMRELMPAGSSTEIPDPYGQDYASYEACRDSMVEAIPGIVQKVREILEEEKAQK
jgi:protein-tyrosine phosphatase